MAGGSGTRLYPLTLVTSKQLLPVYNKPLIYYPMSILMLAGIKDILVIATPHDLPRIRDLLGDGGALGISLSYAVQEEPRGIAEAFLIGRDFGRDEPICLILGDNIFHGQDLVARLNRARALASGANIFAIRVSDPSGYGSIEFDDSGRTVRIVEKPHETGSSWVATGLYFYDSQVFEIAASLKPSARGELEITDINNRYLENGRLHVEMLSRGSAWFDAGTIDQLLAAGNYVSVIESRQGVAIGCLEEVAFRQGFIDRGQLAELADAVPQSFLQKYLRDLLSEPIDKFS